MTWAATAAATATGFSSGSGTSIATSGTLSVTAGDLIYVAVHWEGADTTLSCADGGVNTYTQINYGSANGNCGATVNNEPWLGGFWAVAATTTTLTITATYGAARTFRTIEALCEHPDAAGTISLDGTPTGTGTTGNVATGNITTSTQDTNCGKAFAGFSFYGDDPTAESINGTAAGEIVTNNGAEVWSLRYTNGFTGQGTATHPSNWWASGIAAFKIVASGGGAYNAVPVLEYYLSRRQTGVFH